MSNAPSIEPYETSLTREVVHAIRYYLGGRRTLFVLAALLIVGGIALNWGWLVAIGVAPILVALLPCAVMCALGLCMHRMAGGQHGAGKTAAGTRTQIAHTPDLVDPVSGRPLPCAMVVATARGGRVYYFETRANREAFEAEPEKYLAELPANGVSNQPDRSDRPSGCT
jgi:YHS domain-containing protein